MIRSLIDADRVYSHIGGVFIKRKSRLCYVMLYIFDLTERQEIIKYTNEYDLHTNSPFSMKLLVSLYFYLLLSKLSI